MSFIECFFNKLKDLRPNIFAFTRIICVISNNLLLYFMIKKTFRVLQVGKPMDGLRRRHIPYLLKDLNCPMHLFRDYFDHCKKVGKLACLGN